MMQLYLSDFAPLVERINNTSSTMVGHTEGEAAAITATGPNVEVTMLRARVLQLEAERARFNQLESDRDRQLNDIACDRQEDSKESLMDKR
jgi:hypothetical protein